MLNANGKKFIEMCRGSNIFIANGRIGEDKDVGQFTYRGTSLIDYTLATVEALKLISKFSIIERDPILAIDPQLLPGLLILPLPRNTILTKLSMKNPESTGKMIKQMYLLQILIKCQLKSYYLT